MATKIRSVLATLTTSGVVFLLVYWSVWHYEASTVRSRSLRFACLDFYGRKIVNALETYRQKHGSYPKSLDDLPASQEDWGDSVLQDPWKRPYYYVSHGDRFDLLCLGRDGELGGEGIDADIDMKANDVDLKIRPTLSQFLFESECGRIVWWVAIFASFCAGFICFLVSSPRKENRATMLAIIISSGVAACFAVFHGSVFVSVLVRMRNI